MNRPGLSWQETLLVGAGLGWSGDGCLTGASGEGRTGAAVPHLILGQLDLPSSRFGQPQFLQKMEMLPDQHRLNMEVSWASQQHSGPIMDPIAFLFVAQGRS